MCPNVWATKRILFNISTEFTHCSKLKTWVADVSGSISGQIQISETLSLMSESYIQGDITTAKLSVEEGAQVDATIVMKTGKQLKAVETNSVNDKKSEAEKTA